MFTVREAAARPARAASAHWVRWRCERRRQARPRWGRAAATARPRAPDTAAGTCVHTERLVPSRWTGLQGRRWPLQSHWPALDWPALGAPQSSAGTCVSRVSPAQTSALELDWNATSPVRSDRHCGGQCAASVRQPSHTHTPKRRPPSRSIDGLESCCDLRSANEVSDGYLCSGQTAVS